jgi:predicted nucleic acid-binding protein
MAAATWLLDTCVLSEVIKPQPDTGVLNWLGEHQGQGCISVVTLAELNFGVRRLPAGKKRAQIQDWITNLRAGFAERIVATDEPVWLAYAGLKADLLGKGKVREDIDLLIAATAFVHGLTLVTRNTRHFLDTGVFLLNPWN